MSAELSPRQFAVKAIHEDNLNVKNPSILAKLLKNYAQSLLKEKQEIIERLKHGMKAKGSSDAYIEVVVKTPLHIQEKVRADLDKPKI